MRKRAVLVDSSIWIRFFRNATHDPACELLTALLRQKLVATNWLIRMELLSGASAEDGYRTLDADLAALRQLPLTEPLFQAAGLMRWRLHRKGVIIPVVDSLIAACAIHYGCSLLHDDRHFQLLARHTPLTLQPI